MLIVFALIVMRISGAVLFNPVLGRSNLPSQAKAALILMLSMLLYVSTGDASVRQPVNMLEFGVMLLMELLVGFVIAYVMELAFLVVRFASSIMDYSMGLTMAQVYDPQTNTQVNVTSNLYYGFLFLLFLAMDGHIWLIRLFFQSVDIVPLGEVALRPVMAQEILTLFQESITMGLQFAFPLLAMELVTEAAVGILMRMIPQINVFVVNFQIKISVGLLMLVYLFSPMSDQMYVILERMFRSMEQILPLLG